MLEMYSESFYIEQGHEPYKTLFGFIDISCNVWFLFEFYGSEILREIVLVGPGSIRSTRAPRDEEVPSMFILTLPCSLIASQTNEGKPKQKLTFV